MVSTAGVLYVVATPIGNLADLGQRALATLAEVDLVAAEDTRHSQRLLGHYGITTRLVALHEHNERGAVAGLVDQLLHGTRIALISDAGTPLISDPGFRLVRAARSAGVAVVPVPGPCAAICALSVAGLPTDRFVFEGFLPARAAARRARLEALADETRTLVFYEAGRRLAACLDDLCATFGRDRPAVLARELTKLHETVLDADLGTLAERVASDPDQRLGESVLLVGGAPEAATQMALDVERLLEALLAEGIAVSRAAAVAARVSGLPKRTLYARAQALHDARGPRSE
jgi:16S rRNA (cytidine1402-2'-O)-methyltransferase